jgi:hypothetical protein
MYYVWKKGGQDSFKSEVGIELETVSGRAERAPAYVLPRRFNTVL